MDAYIKESAAVKIRKNLFAPVTLFYNYLQNFPRPSAAPAVTAI
ncbi:MAG TPA: hypothetical protein VF721_12835 [Pyrinomonadaceae bacterium]|jgi:hypothetical protein